MPKLKPRTNSGISPARRFRRTGRSVTRWHRTRRPTTTRTKSGGDVRALWFEVRVVTGLPNLSGFRGASSDIQSKLNSERHEGCKTDPSSLSPDAPSGQNGAPSPNTSAGNSGVTPERTGGADEPPDVSPDFRSEMASIRAYYAARIAAARGSLPAGDMAAAVKALLNEEAIALRNLAERWRAATERQRLEKPQRPMGPVQRKDDDPKSS